MVGLITRYQFNMERKIGEIFVFEGRKLKVEKAKPRSCDGCSLVGQCCLEKRIVTGECIEEFRDDETDVIFREVTDEETK